MGPVGEVLRRRGPVKRRERSPDEVKLAQENYPFGRPKKKDTRTTAAAPESVLGKPRRNFYRKHRLPLLFASAALGGFSADRIDRADGLRIYPMADKVPPSVFAFSAAALGSLGAAYLLEQRDAAELLAGYATGVLIRLAEYGTAKRMRGA